MLDLYLYICYLPLLIFYFETIPMKFPIVLPILILLEPCLLGSITTQLFSLYICTQAQTDHTPTTCIDFFSFHVFARFVSVAILYQRSNSTA